MWDLKPIYAYNQVQKKIYSLYLLTFLLILNLRNTYDCKKIRNGSKIER